MPRTAVDYSKCVIYRISHKEIAGLDYVGSTVNFLCRKGQHKTHCTNENSTSHHFKVYQTIRDNGGWDSFQMLEVKKYPCQDKREAEMEEERCRHELKAVLNTRRAFRTDEERKEYQSLHHNQYCKDNKDMITKINKKHYMQHREKIIESQKIYNEKNKESIIKYQTKYREKNKERAKEQYTCLLCQCSMRTDAKKRHERSQKHQANLVL
jgi:hypothetical protein